MSGRKKDAVWVYFNEKKSDCGKFNKAVCKHCNKELMGLVARMKKHLETCVTEMVRNISSLLIYIYKSLSIYIKEQTD